jgi:hypothetical protein
MVQEGRSDQLDAFYREQAPGMVRLASLLTGGSGAAEERVQASEEGVPVT